MMNQALTELVEILGDELSRHQALEFELAQEADHDGEMSGSELLGFQSRKLQIVQSIRDLEYRRETLVKSMAENWGEPAAALTLRHIISRAPENLGQKLTDCHGALKQQMERIRKLGETTSANASARLKAIDATLAVVRDAMKIHSTYSGEGMLHKRTPSLKSTSV